MRILACCAILAACSCTAAPPTTLLWSIGSWRGERIDAASGSRAPMTVHIRPILGGSGMFEEIEIPSGAGAYRGSSMTTYDKAASRWVRQYVNNARGHFVQLVGSRDPQRPGDTWDVDSETRPARLTNVRNANGTWLRIMRVRDRGSDSWRELWRDELVRQ